MKFKISSQNRNGHKRLVTCVAWSSTEEIYSCGYVFVFMKNDVRKVKQLYFFTAKIIY